MATDAGSPLNHSDNSIMRKILIFLSLLLSACSPGDDKIYYSGDRIEEVYVCVAGNYMHTFTRDGERFARVLRANSDSGSAQTLEPDYWNILKETEVWLFLSRISIDELEAGLVATIMNKETGLYVIDSVRSIEFEARKETGNCVKT